MDVSKEMFITEANWMYYQFMS